VAPGQIGGADSEVLTHARWRRTGTTAVDSFAEVALNAPGCIRKKAASTAADVFVTGTCIAAVIGFTGGLGTPGALGCKAVGKAAGTAAGKATESSLEKDERYRR
jgi:hypothetical protein